MGLCPSGVLSEWGLVRVGLCPVGLCLSGVLSSGVMSVYRSQQHISIRLPYGRVATSEGVSSTYRRGYLPDRQSEFT